MFKVCVNVSNLHVGGGVQVAVSFLYEIVNICSKKLSYIHVIVSSEIDRELSSLSVNTAVFGGYEVVDAYGVQSFFSKLNSKVKSYDLMFTVFGPNYLRIKAKREIVGFAQQWMLEFNNPVSEQMSFFSKSILRLKFYVQWLFFLRADHYIVELEHVKKSLIEKKGINSKKISVVYNTVSSLYLDKSLWKPIFLQKKQEKISLGIITRDYPHKNLNILPSIAKALDTKHNLKVHFYTTLNDAEWATKNTFFKRYVSTVGSISPDQCPSFYEQVDGVVFPSLLECFSATPLEAMVMKKPLFASDRGFVRDVCGDHAMYFDPLDAEDIALKIANYFKSDTERTESLQIARNHALNFSSARGRAEQYLEIIQQYLKG